MSFLHRLLYLFGILQDPTPQPYNLDTDLHLRIANLAQQEQRTPQEITRQLLNQALLQQEAAEELWQRWQSLSPREQQVAALAALGYSNAEIARFLAVTIDTVKTHVSSILVKFGIRSRKELAMLLANWNFDNFLPPG